MAFLFLEQIWREVGRSGGTGERGSKSFNKEWFAESIKVVGTGKDTYFWEEVWKGGEECSKKYNRLFSISLCKESKVVDLCVHVEGRKGIEAYMEERAIPMDGRFSEAAYSGARGEEY